MIKITHNRNKNSPTKLNQHIDKETQKAVEQLQQQSFSSPKLKKVRIEEKIQQKEEDQANDQGQLDVLLKMYAKDNKARVDYKKKELANILDEIKEGQQDKKEQKQLLDNKMKLYYLIREYQKETREDVNLFQDDNIIDLNFLDQVKKHKNENLTQKIMRRKLVYKYQDDRRGDLAELDSSQEEIDVKMLYLENNLTSVPNSPDKSNTKKFVNLYKAIDANKQCRYCKLKEKGKFVNGKCTCMILSEQQTKIEAQKAIRKRVFGLNEIGTLNQGVMKLFEEKSKHITEYQLHKQGVVKRLRKPPIPRKKLIVSPKPILNSPYKHEESIKNNEKKQRRSINEILRNTKTENFQQTPTINIIHNNSINQKRSLSPTQGKLQQQSINKFQLRQTSVKFQEPIHQRYQSLQDRPLDPLNLHQDNDFASTAVDSLQPNSSIQPLHPQSISNLEKSMLMEKIKNFKLRQYLDEQRDTWCSATSLPPISQGQQSISSFKKQLDYWKQQVKPSHMPKKSWYKQIELQLCENKREMQHSYRKLKVKKVLLDDIIKQL